MGENRSARGSFAALRSLYREGGPATLVALLLFTVLLGPPPLHAQSHGDTLEAQEQFQPNRFWPVMGAAAAVNAAGLYGLTQLWYSKEGLRDFAFYTERLEARYPGYTGDGWLDDWHTYAQQDKLGHVFTAWQLARLFGAYGRWAGFTKEEAGLFGGIAGTVFQMQIELMDGFAREYGFSRTDALANIVGGAIGGLKVAYPERLDWLGMKYSYHFSPYRYENISDNPVISYVGNAIKDYDGVSHWFIVRPEPLLRGRAKAMWPDWLAVSIGYSADDITHAISGKRDPRLGPGPALEHKRVYLLGLDIDILASNDWPEPWHTLAAMLSFIRIPAPAVALGGDGLEWHWLYM